MNTLRDYQQKIYTDARTALSEHKSICLQLATGGGKTAVAAEIVSSVFSKKKRAWFITPRKELVNQASDHFKKWSVPHSRIDADNQESRAFNIHVVSKETLSRRMDKIKNWPDLIMIDECHINLDFQVMLYAAAPETTKFIGWTATPERLDGRGLSTKSGGIYDKLIQGPSIPWLTERGFLTDLKYYAPPLEGLENIKTKGNELDEEELNALLERRKVYGQVVDHYEKYGQGKAALGFCRSVKAAYQMAERFRDRGHNFQTVEGKMSDRELKYLLEAHRGGDIQGLCTCDLVLYGVDIPRVEYGFSVRPTLSRSLYMQMIGRVLRPFQGKTHAIWMDHVNMVLEHQDDKYPGVPLHYVPEISWQFDGVTKRKKRAKDKNIKLCPHLDYFYCDNPACGTCPKNPDRSVKDARKPMINIPVDLKEINKPIPLNQRLPEERREIQDEIGQAVLSYKSGEESAVEKLLKIADKLGYPPMWVYHKLTEENRHTVNIPVLAEIARVKNYKSGWVWVAKQKLKGAR